MDINLDASRFDAAIKQTLTESKRDAADVIRTQLKGFTKNVMGFTYPMIGDMDFSAGKERGQAAMRKGLKKAFKIVEDSKAQKVKSKDEQTLLAVYLSKRNNRKKYRGSRLASISQSTFDDLARRLYTLQGSVAAGWNAMAEKYGFSAQSWIKRWGTSHGYVIDQAEGLGFTVVNSTDHPDSKTMQNLMQMALQGQATKMERASANLAGKNLK